MHHFVIKMCTRVHISVTKWCFMVYSSDALWDLLVGSTQHYSSFKQQYVIYFQDKRPAHTAFNSLADGRCNCYFICVIFQLLWKINILNTSRETALRWMPQDFISVWPTFVELNRTVTKYSKLYYTLCSHNCTRVLIPLHVLCTVLLAVVLVEMVNV